MSFDVHVSYLHSYCQALKFLDLVVSNSKKCLCIFDQRNTSAKSHADLYIEGRLDELAYKERCENGTEQEKELWEFLSSHWDDLYYRHRNSLWAPEMIRVLREKRNSTVLFAFGQGHFTGKHRIQTYLQDAGFRIDHMAADEPYM